MVPWAGHSPSGGLPERTSGFISPSCCSSPGSGSPITCRAALPAAMDSVAFILLVFLCVTLHEFGHIAMARRFGIRTPQVILSPIGGIASMERMPEKPTPGTAGGDRGAARQCGDRAAADGWLRHRHQRVTSIDFETATLAERLLIVNVMLVLFNMVPAFPMDGGRVLRALLAMNMGAPRATALAARIGQGFAFLFVLLGLFYNPDPDVRRHLHLSRRRLRGADGSLHRLCLAAQGEGCDGAIAHPALGGRAAVEGRRCPALLAAEGIPRARRRRPHRGAARPRRDDPRPARPGCRRPPSATPCAPPSRCSSTSPWSTPSPACAQAAPGPRWCSTPQASVAGILTQENIAEMMMVENAQPGWRFRRR